MLTKATTGPRGDKSGFHQYSPGLSGPVRFPVGAPFVCAVGRSMAGLIDTDPRTKSKATVHAEPNQRMEFMESHARPARQPRTRLFPCAFQSSVPPNGIPKEKAEKDFEGL